MTAGNTANPTRACSKTWGSGIREETGPGNIQQAIKTPSGPGMAPSAPANESGLPAPRAVPGSPTRPNRKFLDKLNKQSVHSSRVRERRGLEVVIPPPKS
jgi:hypothetical protein